jgi:hypothetical protein
VPAQYLSNPSRVTASGSGERHAGPLEIRVSGCHRGSAAFAWAAISKSVAPSILPAASSAVRSFRYSASAGSSNGTTWISASNGFQLKKTSFGSNGPVAAAAPSSCRKLLAEHSDIRPVDILAEKVAC